MIKYSRILFLFFILASVANSANHYIRDGGSGDGSAWNNAWDELSDAGLDVAANTSLRGDTFFVADGTYGTFILKVDVSGTDYITIKKAIESDHGTDTGWDSSYGDGQAVFTTSDPVLVSIRTDYWKIDGQVGGGPDNWTSGHGFAMTSTYNDTRASCIDLGQVSVDNQPDFVEIQHIYFNFSQFYFDNEKTCWGIRCELVGGRLEEGNGSKNITISECYFFHVYQTIKATYCQFWTFENNYVDRNWGNPVGSNQSTAWQDFGSDDITIRYNIFKDINGTGALDLKANNCDVFEDWDIYGNIFYFSTANIYDAGMGAATIIKTPGGGACDDMQLSFRLKVHNNTFINMQQASYGSGTSTGGVKFHHDGDNSNECFNNLWWNPQVDDDVSFLNCNNDYNTLWNTDIAPLTDPAGANDEVITSGVSDPFVDWENDDFRLTTNTTAGIDTSGTVAGNSTDMFGNTRGAGGVWNRGALQVIGGGVRYGLLGRNYRRSRYE